jgi:hypothetical protein
MQTLEVFKVGDYDTTLYKGKFTSRKEINKFLDENYPHYFLDYIAVNGQVLMG